MCDFLIPMLSLDITTIDRETFAGLMFAFSTPLKFSQKYFRVALARSAYYLKKGTYIHRKFFLKTVKNTNV